FTLAIVVLHGSHYSVFLSPLSSTPHFPSTTLFRSVQRSEYSQQRQRRDHPPAARTEDRGRHIRRHQLGRCGDRDPRCERRGGGRDRESTRLNSSHGSNSDALLCLKKKNKGRQQHRH